MGTKSYVKPICDPRVHSHSSAGPRVHINEIIQSPCVKEDEKVLKIVDSHKHLYEQANKLKNELNQKDRELIDEILKNCDDSPDDL
jgi:hypothetical protein